MSREQPWSRSHRKTRIIQSRLPSAREMRLAGAQQCLGVKRFGWSSISRNGSGAYRSCLRETKLPARKSSYCGGLPDGGSAVKEIVRQQWNFSPLASIREVEEYQVSFQALLYLNWSLIRISVAESFARRLRTSVCPDVVRGSCRLRASRPNRKADSQNQRNDRHCVFHRTLLRWCHLRRLHLMPDKQDDSAVTISDFVRANLAPLRAVRCKIRNHCDRI